MLKIIINENYNARNFQSTKRVSEYLYRVIKLKQKLFNNTKLTTPACYTKIAKIRETCENSSNHPSCPLTEIPKPVAKIVKLYYYMGVSCTKIL